MNTGSKAVDVIRGHDKGITAVCPSNDFTPQ